MISAVVWVVGLALFVSFFLVVLRGAPWVPTHNRGVNDFFRYVEFAPGDTLVDLGSGDGRIVEAAAQRGICVVGYELNPFLGWYSWLRVRRYKNARIVVGDFWHAKLPDTTTVAFVFLAKPFMGKLGRYLQQEARRLNHDITLVSYGMELPNQHAIWKKDGLVAYRFGPKA